MLKKTVNYSVFTVGAYQIYTFFSQGVKTPWKQFEYIWLSCSNVVLTHWLRKFGTPIGGTRGG